MDVGSRDGDPRALKNRIMSDLAEQYAVLLSDEQLALELYTPSDAAKLFKVSGDTVRSWIKKGYIKAERLLSEHHGKYAKPREVWCYLIKAEEIDRIQSSAPRLAVYTMRFWPRLLYKLEHGDPVR